jgi:hypothetical protein
MLQRLILILTNKMVYCCLTFLKLEFDAYIVFILLTPLLQKGEALRNISKVLSFAPVLLYSRRIPVYLPSFSNYETFRKNNISKVTCTSTALQKAKKVAIKSKRECEYAHNS